MKKSRTIAVEFVDLIPGALRDGTLYVSMSYATAVHKCCCGCGHEVVTPLSPRDWALIFDGETVSLLPSIGNWSFPCQSHYWIKHNQIHWARAWTKREITAGRKRDDRRTRCLAKSDMESLVSDSFADDGDGKEAMVLRRSFWQRIRRWMSR